MTELAPLAALVTALIGAAWFWAALRFRDLETRLDRLASKLDRQADQQDREFTSLHRDLTKTAR